MPDTPPLLDPSVRSNNTRAAVRVAAAFSLAGLIWVVVSDVLLASAGGMSGYGLRVAVAKGAAFVLLTAGLVFWLGRRELRTAARGAAMLRAIAEGTDDAVFVKDRDGRYLLFNDAAARLVGKPVAEVLGRDDTALFDPAGAEQVMARDRRVMGTGRPETEEETLTAGGVTRTYLATKAPYRDDAGAVVGVVGVSRDVTAARRAEAALRRSEERLRLALDAAQLGVWEVRLPSGPDHPERVNHWDEGYGRLFGLTPAQLPRAESEFFALVHPDDREAVAAAFEGCVAGAADYVAEFRAIGPDGRVRWHSSQGRLLRDAAGNPERVIGVGRDVTGRKEAERALRLARFSVERAVDAVFWVAPSGAIEYANEAAHRVLGYPPGGLVGRTVPDIDPNFPADAWPAHWEEVTRRGSFTFESDHRTRDGGTVPTEVTVNYLRHEDREYNCAVMRDVTARKRAERALSESEERFRALVEDGYEGINVLDSTGWSVYSSPRNATLLGLTPGEVNDDALGFVHPDDRPAAAAALAAVQAAPDHTADLEVRLVRKDGTWFWAEVHARNMLDHPAVRGIVVNWRDVTDRKRVEAAARESERRLAAFMANTPTLAWVNDEFGRTHLVNPAWERAYGKPASSLTGRPVAETLAGHPTAEYLASDRRVLDTGAPCTAVETGPRPDGSTGTYLVTKFPLGASADGCRLIGGVAVDITDRAAAETALRASEERLRLALLAGRMGTFDWDLRTGRVVWSDTHFDLWGYPAHDRPPVSYQAFIGRVHPDDRAAAEAAVERSRRDRAPYRCEHRIVLPSGEVRWIAGRGEFQYGPAGEPVRMLGTVQDVTDRKLAEQAVCESERRYRELADAIPQIVWTADRNGALTHLNAKVAEYTGRPAGDLTGWSWDVAIHPDDLPALVREWGETIRTGVPRLIEFRIRRADGAYRWHLSRQTPALDATGAPVGWYGTLTDVDDLKATQAALRAGEERYRRLVEVLPTALAVHDGERVTFCNPALVRLLGAASADELVGREVLGFVHPDFHPAVRARLAAMRASGQPGGGLELRLVRTDGRTVPAYSVATPVSDAGRPAFISALSDLSERNRATQMLEAVMGSVGDAIVTTDTAGTIVSANPATERLFGHPPAELTGQSIGLLLPEPHREGHDEYIARYLRTGEPRVLGAGRELEGRRRDGSTFPLELTVTEFRLDGERHFAGVMRDITARRRLEEQFRQAQKMEAVGRLAGGVAHDFNNLLTVINGYADLMLMGLPPEDPQRGAAAAVRDAGERAAALTSQLLAFSRKTIVAPKVFDLRDVLTQAERLLRRLIGEDVALAVVSHAAPCRVNADPAQIDQVVLNLAVNARDAMPTGGRLTLETKPVTVPEPGRGGAAPGEYVELTVSDTGCGMNDEVMARIFEPFFTTKGVGQGTGLGLATVHGIVYQAGGHIEVTSRVGHGTTFRVLLPAVAPAPEADPVAVTAAGRGTEAVLLVEDDEAVRALCALALESQGYTVLAAPSGPRALELLRARPAPARLLVTDVVMPEMSGRELADAAVALSPGLKVLFVSGYTDDAVLRHGVREAADHFLQKPFSPLTLARKVREVLDAR